MSAAAETLRLAKRRGIGFDVSRYGLRFGSGRVWTADPDDEFAYEALLGLAAADGSVLMFRTADGWVEA